jgi:hypothetical protein
MAEFTFNGPLDPALVKAFDRATDAVFELGRLAITNDDFEEEHVSADKIVGRLGLRLFNGDDGLLNAVLNCLGDGPAEGDVEGALSVLWDMGVVDLSDDVLNQIHAVR